MVSITKSPMWQTAMYGVSVLLMRGISFFMLPYVISQLTTLQFGILELMTASAMFFSVVLSFGLEHALYRFVGVEQDQERKVKVMSNIYRLCLILCALAILLNPLLSMIVANSFDLKNVKSLISIMFITLSFETLVSVPLAWLRMKDRCLAFCSVSIIWTVLRAGCLVLFFNLGFSLESVFYAGFISTGIISIILYFLIRQDLRKGLPIYLCKEYLYYGIPLVGSGLLAFLLSGLDRWLLASHIGLEQLAIYAVGAKFALLVALSMQPYGMWYMPKRFLILNGDDGQRKSLNFSLFGIFLVLMAALFIGFFGPVFVLTFLPGEYQPVIEIMPYFIIWATFKELTEYVNVGCLASTNTRIQLYINLISACIGMVIMVLFVQEWTISGVLFGLIVAYGMRFLLFLIIGERQIKIIFPKTKIFTLIFTVMSLLMVQSMQGEVSSWQYLEQYVLSLVFIVLVVCLLFKRDLCLGPHCSRIIDRLRVA